MQAMGESTTLANASQYGLTQGKDWLAWSQWAPQCICTETGIPDKERGMWVPFKHHVLSVLSRKPLLEEAPAKWKIHI